MSIDDELTKRSDSKCELCSSGSGLSVYEVPPLGDNGVDRCVMICGVCRGQVDNPDALDANHWRCLNESMWSEYPAVQVMAWRMLNALSSEGWAQDLFTQLYLEEETLKWAESIAGQGSDSSDSPKDSFGNVLATGDTVTIIKDLDVKGAGFTAKRGTVVRKISTTDDPTHIQGRVNGTQIFLKTCFLKKS